MLDLIEELMTIMSETDSKYQSMVHGGGIKLKERELIQNILWYGYENMSKLKLGLMVGLEKQDLPAVVKGKI